MAGPSEHETLAEMTAGMVDDVLLGAWLALAAVFATNGSCALLLGALYLGNRWVYGLGQPVRR